MPCGTAPLLVSRCQSGRPPGSTASTVASSAGLSASSSAEPTASPSSSAKAPAAESSDAGPSCVSGSSGTVGSDGVGTVGSADKAKLARSHGAAHVIDYTKENFVERVKEITGGRKVPVVYDSVGKSTWEGSLDCLQPLGLWVIFGNASGPVPPLNTQVLAQKGSLFMTRPTLQTYIASRPDLEARSASLFDAVKSGKVKIEVSARYKLADAAQCHRDLEGRKTTGSVILTP